MNGMKGPSFTILRAAVLTLAVAGCSEFDVTSLKDNASGDEPAPDTGEFPTDTGFVPPPDGVPLGQLSHDRVHALAHHVHAHRVSSRAAEAHVHMPSCKCHLDVEQLAKSAGSGEELLQLSESGRILAVLF